MSALNRLIDLQLTIFLLMAAGYIMTRLGLLPVSARKPLTNLVIDFILPCNIIVSFLIEFNAQILADCLRILLLSVLVQGVSFALGWLLFRRLGPQEQPVMRYAVLISNAGFLGSPIAEGLYGAQGLLYASIYLIPMRIMMWSSGVSMFAGVKGKDVVKKTLTHPCIVAAILGLVLMLTQFQLPSGLEQALRTASNCNTALSMIVIGNILAEVDPRTVLSARSLLYCLLRLVLMPLAVLGLCRLAGIDHLVAAVAVVLVGMPAASTTAILAARYDRDERLAVTLVFLSTVGSLLTIPALAMLMEFI